ncbi:MAG: ABC transporter permease [Bradymonadales bacterium]|nr:ABC transporter permease [Bradymonadales bacterium]
MNLLMVFKVALRALLRNKMRSFLTLLGIIIGVSAVIAMVAIGQGAQKRVEDTFSSMGSNLIIVRSGSHGAGGARGGVGSRLTLTWTDLEAIQTELSSVQVAAPVLQTRAQLLSELDNWNTQVLGTSPEYFLIRSWSMASGSVFTQADVEGATQTAVLGQTVVDELFGANYDPVGQAIRINNVPFLVTGVLEEKGQSQWGEDFDDVVLVPYSTYRARISGGLQQYIPGSIFVAATDPDDTSRTELELTQLLRERHSIAELAEEDFSVHNLTEMAEAQQEGTRTFTMLLASIAAVSLLVGGIGIMNIMLVSVTERTREIGLRMAVGARPTDILAQFLVESLTLSIVGGLLGVAIGISAAHLLSKQYGWSLYIPPDIVIIAVLFSALVGVLFGLYPARKAAKLDPIEALRYE